MSAHRIFRTSLLLVTTLALAQSCATETAAPGSPDVRHVGGAAGGPPEVAVTSEALTTPTPTDCYDYVFQGHNYRHCVPLQSAWLTWTQARDRCRSFGPNVDLISIESADEDFFAGWTAGILPMWIGANDITTENQWRWSLGDVHFLNAPTPPGTPVAGRYENFPAWEPVPDIDNPLGGALDCANIRPGTFGVWMSTSCLERSTYLCEEQDACPADPLKTSPGTCGCGIADTDTDADTVPNCIDLCPNDRLKTEPGVLGCGALETDTDRDGLPDGLDEAPTDVTVQKWGTCGRPGAFAPAGTSCGDAPCLGRFTCDGVGRCGTAASCPVPTGGGACTFRRYLDKGYWFCPSLISWTTANTACRSIQGAHLVEIETPQENAFVTANLSADAWIGGNDSTTEGQWRWTKYTSNNGQRFWDGAATGTPYFARYSKWISGQPAASASTDDCAMITGVAGTNRSRWDDRLCTQTRGFVCELPLQRLTGRPWKTGPTTFTTLYGLPTTPERSYAGCVSEATALGPNTDANELVVLDDARRCHDACQTAFNAGQTVTACQTACNTRLNGQPSIASVPPSTATCPAWSAQETSLCKLSARGLSGGVPRKCNIDAECATMPVGSRRCGFYADPTRPLGTNPDGSRRFATGRYCGTPDDNCPDTLASADPARCRETLICDIQHQQTVTTLTAPGADLAPEPVNPVTEFGAEPTPPAPPAYANQNNPCPGGFLGACNLDTNHPWCNYDVNDSVLTSDKGMGGDGYGQSGDASASEDLISFYFEPTMVLNYDAGLGPLGLPRANLTAQAGLRAGVDVGPIVVNLPPFDVVDVLAAVEGSQCGVSTADSYVRVMEQDFVPTGGRPVGPQGSVKTRCDELYTQFEDAANRANKALRDALYLIRTYRANPAGTGFANLCQQIAATAPRGFPTVANCATESPEATIARFVTYYRNSVLGFAASAGVKSVTQIAQDFASLSIVNATVFGSGYDTGLPPATVFSHTPEPEEITIVNAQFFIGPIPCNLEVYSALEYGVHVNLHWALNPGGVINSMLLSPAGTSQTSIAKVKVDGAPFATALLGVFAGAGFDVGPVAAKFGVDARLTLGTVVVPAYAEAGLNLGAENDTRAVPTEFETGLWGTQPSYLIPPKRYSVSLVYGAGLSAQVRDVLTGSVNARLKLKFFFFSKSWSKRLFGFSGFCSPPTPACEHSLVSVEGSNQLAAFDDHAWNKIAMPSPFPDIIPPFGLGGTPPSTVPVLTGPVEEFFYDSLCTCITGNTDTKTNLARDCLRNDDCCSATPFCFSDPATSPAGRNSCVASCRSRGQSCNTGAAADECCGADRCFNDPSDTRSYGICAASCQPAAAPCTVDSDCCSPSTHSCVNPPGGASYGTCQPKAACFGFCESSTDCRTGLFCSGSQCILPASGCLG